MASIRVPIWQKEKLRNAFAYKCVFYLERSSVRILHEPWHFCLILIYLQSAAQLDLVQRLAFSSSIFLVNRWSILCSSTHVWQFTVLSIGLFLLEAVKLDWNWVTSFDSNILTLEISVALELLQNSPKPRRKWCHNPRTQGKIKYKYKWQ